MVELSSLFKFGNLSGIVGSLVNVLIFVFGTIFLCGIIIFFVARKRKKAAYNIPVTIWIPRSDNKIVDEVTGTGGYFKSKSIQGITTFRLKRKGCPIVEIPPPGSKYLVGLNRHLYLVQKGMDDFEPVLPEGFLYVTTESGKRIPIVNLKCVNQDATAWNIDNAETAKKRFTIRGMWEKYKDIIEITIFIFIVFLAIYITWSGLKDVVVGLKDVADALKQPVSSAVQIS